MAATNEVLATAIEMHRTGQLAAALPLYQAVLAREQDNADALHLLGVLHHQQGDQAKAIELIGRAVALRPGAFAFHANLAEAYRAQGQFDRAIGCCRMALSLAPDYPEALCNLGASLQGQGKQAESIEYFRRALALVPDFAVAHNNLGIALRETRDTETALEHFRRAVELEPTFAAARTNLGQMLLDRGEAEAALPHCQEAVRLQPNVAAMHHNLGNALRALERHFDARVAYLEALRLEPNLAISHAHLGLTLGQQNESAEALQWLKKATELEPGNATFWEYLAEAHDEQEEPAHSIPCWRRVLELGEERAGPHLSLGWALQEEGRLDEAAEHYQAAARLNPEGGMPPMSLAGVYEEQGKLAEAEAALREAIRLQPQFALPHARLATLLRGKMNDEDLVALADRIADENIGNGPRARMLFAQAHVFDARRDYAQAAECLRKANALTLELNHKRRDYSPEEHQQFVDMLVNQFNPEFFERLHGAGSDSRRPVFVFGLPRSGTTLTEQVLASHPEVHGAGELRLVRGTFESLPEAVGHAGFPRDALPRLTPPVIANVAARHLERLADLDGGQTPRLVDKMPDNYMYLGLLAALFPRATFIHCRRDLRDIAVSCWMTDFRSIRWANSPQHITTRFQQYQRLMDHWRHVLPAPIHDVDYEEIVEDLEGVARRLIDVCGLEWDPACLEFYRYQRPVRTASVTQVRQPVYKQSVARWKNYEADLAEVFAALGNPS
ncbi:MAG TPA: tetratricopeptide repeat protein [Pirellulales bacterium]|nr:tetratricopeptide repeat protein [Pirellulales bacterium]